MNTFALRRRQRRWPWLALLLLTTLVGYRQVTAQFAAAPELVAGSYAGTVLVSEPAPLGDLDLLLDITSVNGQLTGQVNPAKTQVFLGGPTFTGSVTVNQGSNPTVQIASQTFSGVVSGRTVQRHFVLTGEVLAAGNELRGVYTETITGFKPQPMIVKGTFLLMRPDGVTAIISVPTPRGSPPATPTVPGTGGTATPTATATATTPPVNGEGAKLYLPIVRRAGAASAAAVEVNSVAATPTPSAPPTLAVMATPPPTTLVLDANPVLTTTAVLTAADVLTTTAVLTMTDVQTTTAVLTTTDVQQQILLPLIMR